MSPHVEVTRLSRLPANRAATLIFALLFVACHTSTEPELSLSGPEPVKTDAVSYRLVRGEGEYRTYVTATYRNATTAPVHFARCNGEHQLPMYYVARTGPDSTRTFHVDWAWACVGGVPVGSIPPGARVTVQVSFGSIDQPGMFPPLKPEDLVGLFRIYMTLCVGSPPTSDQCVLLPPAQRQSNAFWIHY